MYLFLGSMALLKEPPSLLLLLMLIHVGLLFLSSCPSVLAQEDNNGEIELTHIYCLETVFIMHIEHILWSNFIVFQIEFASEIKFTGVQSQQRSEKYIVKVKQHRSMGDGGFSFIA